MIKKTTIAVLALTLFASCQQEADLKLYEGLQVKSSAIIVGNSDDRREMTNYDPSIVSIMAKGGSTVCSATVIGPHHVITAAHCLYDQKTDSYRRERYVVPAFNSSASTKPHQRFFIDNIYIPHLYVELAKGSESIPSQALIHDIAIIEVKDTYGNVPFADQTYSASIEAFDQDYHLENQSLALKAYHGDLKESTPYEQEGCAFKIVYRDDLIGHTCDIFKGSSGASLQINNTIVAINIAELEQDYNIGNPITHQRADAIESIIRRQTQGSFRKISYDQKPYTGIEVKNNCNEEVLIAFKYQTENKDWIFDGHYKLAPGDFFISPVQAHSTNIYYQAQTPNRSKTWEGNHKALSSRNQAFLMKRIETEARFYDHRLNINCN